MTDLPRFYYFSYPMNICGWGRTIDDVCDGVDELPDVGGDVVVLLKVSIPNN
jgi:hypothetical protein